MARKQDKLTKEAKGRDCTVQLFPYCNFNPETTIFAHFNSESKGVALKSENWWGSFCCSDCHDIIDGRRAVDDISPLEIEQAKFRSLHRTLKIQIEEGNIKI